LSDRFATESTADFSGIHTNKCGYLDYLKTLDRGAADVADIIDSFDQRTEQINAQHEE